MKKYTGIIKIATLIILLPIIIWELSLKKTYMLYKKDKHAEVLFNEIESGQLSSKEPSMFISDPIISNAKLLEIVASDLVKQQIQVVQYNPSLVSEAENYKLYSGVLTLQGNFIHLVKIIDLIEKMKLHIKLSSVNFSHNLIRGKSVNKIELTLTFQQIEI